jgi:hypothetical protein
MLAPSCKLVTHFEIDQNLIHSIPLLTLAYVPPRHLLPNRHRATASIPIGLATPRRLHPDLVLWCHILSDDPT